MSTSLLEGLTGDQMRSEGILLAVERMVKVLLIGRVFHGSGRGGGLHVLGGFPGKSNDVLLTMVNELEQTMTYLSFRNTS
jgi:hypothetical protein